MAYGICVPNKTMSQNVDTKNRVAMHTTVDLENGQVVQLLSQSATAGEGEVWVASQPAATTGLQNLWMVWSPEIVSILSGTYEFKGLDPDPRNFINKQDRTFDAFKPEVDDIITLTDDAITGTRTNEGYVVATASDYQLNWAANAVSGLSLKLLSTDYITIGAGFGTTGRVTAYKFVVTAIA